ncbi:sugar ABC transporter ATP-binding protein [Miniphocaeibacter halophilus]|uniref:Sugar ABC transporter ATP-binding protein n=1 Tax=Miniphocaeibacter halophilus TaxID=2931922 RepID=A0AC61MRN2_9FIRM|nr:sugar ABC transporter ATP-binding protein [Miniphocaeibacter halophilus]QQK07081.1 sugar ABC transporter ATP-binding protein [Miniphocaeibacter halophilus]
MHIVMKGINKSFGDNKVLKNTEFELLDGEVHALMGENGAGKSTLMKILTGVYTKDSGEIYVDDKLVNYKNPQEAEKDGIVFIYQELNSLFDLTVMDNLFITKEIKKGFGILDKNAMYIKAKEALESLGVNINPKSIMSDLSVGQQQMVEICKALMVDAKTIIMDEPTAALTQSETAILFDVIKNLKSKGVSIVYISHRMEEIFEVCDRITVLRDGEYIGTSTVEDTDMNRIVKMMIGRELGDRFPKRQHELGEVILEIKDLNKIGEFSNVSFKLRQGEVLGVSGLMGAGRTEIMSCIFGDNEIDGGEIYVEGKRIHIKNPNKAIENGIAYVTEDRKVEGLMLEKTIEENITIANLKDISKNAILSKNKINKLAKDSIEKFKIKSTGINHICEKLSGGNQQKVVLSKWVATNPRILILDEPTRGVDIGAKQDIYNIINDLANDGVGIIMVSSELPEILGMSDRVMVVREGEVKGILDIEEADQEKIMTLATGGVL